MTWSKIYYTRHTQNSYSWNTLFQWSSSKPSFLSGRMDHAWQKSHPGIQAVFWRKVVFFQSSHTFRIVRRPGRKSQSLQVLLPFSPQSYFFHCGLHSWFALRGFEDYFEHLTKLVHCHHLPRCKGTIEWSRLIILYNKNGTGQLQEAEGVLRYENHTSAIFLGCLFTHYSEQLSHETRNLSLLNQLLECKHLPCQVSHFTGDDLQPFCVMLLCQWYQAIFPVFRVSRH